MRRARGIAIGLILYAIAGVAVFAMVVGGIAWVRKGGHDAAVAEWRPKFEGMVAERDVALGERDRAKETAEANARAAKECGDRTSALEREGAARLLETARARALARQTAEAHAKVLVVLEERSARPAVVGSTCSTAWSEIRVAEGL